MYRDDQTGVVITARAAASRVKCHPTVAIPSGKTPVLPLVVLGQYSRYRVAVRFLPVYARPNITVPHDHTVGPLNIVLFHLIQRGGRYHTGHSADQVVIFTVAI